jgi:hypothetical protein
MLDNHTVEAYAANTIAFYSAQNSIILASSRCRMLIRMPDPGLLMHCYAIYKYCNTYLFVRAAKP